MHSNHYPHLLRRALLLATLGLPALSVPALAGSVALPLPVAGRPTLADVPVSVRVTQRPADVSAYLTNARQMTMKVFSPAPGIPFQITMQDSTRAGATTYPAGRHSEYIATTDTNAWETLVFNNVGCPDATISSTLVNELVLLIAPNTTTTTPLLPRRVVWPYAADAYAHHGGPPHRS